jgi:predicted dehydrogenase
MTSTDGKVQLGLIGCGWVAEERHLPALHCLPDARVVAVADTDPTRLTEVADRFGIETRYADSRALLEHPGIEAVAICTPAHSHAAVARLGLEAGIHLFIEKPLVLSLDESDRLIEQAARSTGKVMVGFNMRWHRLVRKARAIIQQGTLGPVKAVCSTITSQFRADEPTWMRRRELGGGVLIELAVHSFDLWRFLLQSELETVSATSRSGRWDDETATITAQMSNGVLATALVSKGTAESNELDVYGQEGRLRVSCYRFDGLEFRPSSSYPGSVRTRLRGVIHSVTSVPQAIAALRGGGDYLTSYRAEWQHFINTIRCNSSVESTLEDGHRALQGVLAAVESASQGRPVPVSRASRKITPITPNVPAAGNQH